LIWIIFDAIKHQRLRGVRESANRSARESQLANVMASARILATLIAALLLAPASAQTIYKYVSPGGQVTYSETPVPGARRAEEFTPAPEVSPATLDSARTREAARDKALSEAADQRIVSLDAARNELNVWSARLQQAEAQLQAGREPQPGERTGVVYQHRSRLNQAYWARQQKNEAAVAEAEAHVQHAQAMIQALR
jgi:Domain of unknown function (DUF4124)